MKPGNVSASERRPPPIVGLRFAYDRFQSSPRKHDGGSETVGTGAYDDGVRRHEPDGGVLA